MNGNILINNDCTDFSAEGYAALGVLLEMVWGMQTMGYYMARDKLTDLLAARGADWDIRMRRLDDADLEREMRIFGAS